MGSDTEDDVRRKGVEAEERRKESHNMVAELRASGGRELLECVVALLNHVQVDTWPQRRRDRRSPTSMTLTDLIDPACEFEPWRLRELFFFF